MVLKELIPQLKKKSLHPVNCQLIMDNHRKSFFCTNEWIRQDERFFYLIDSLFYQLWTYTAALFHLTRDSPSPIHPAPHFLGLFPLYFFQVELSEGAQLMLSLTPPSTPLHMLCKYIYTLLYNKRFERIFILYLINVSKG